jgi:hypothetical protein
MNLNMQRFLRSPTPDEWARFRVYARRMTRLYAPQNDWVPSDDILHLVNLDRSGQTLMPRLKLLDWTTGRASLPWLHRLLSPNLSIINIDFTGGQTTPVNVAVIKALPTADLKHIALSTLRSGAEVDSALLEFVLNSKRLESIYIQQDMHTGDNSPSGDVIMEEWEPAELESLKSMKVTFKTEPTFLPSLFNRTKLPSIHEIHIKHSGNSDWPGGDDLLDSILRSAAPGVLRALRYSSNHHGVDITSTRIQSLQHFVALRILRVTSLCTTTRCKFSLSDDDVSAIAISMPNLVELHLGGTPCSSTVNVSINGLAALAANCVKLTELQIHFDTARFIARALDVSSERTIPTRPIQDPCQLTQLIVGRVPLRSGADGYWTVGIALLQIFPNLKIIKCQHMGLFDGWGEVMKVLKVQRNVASLMVVRRANLLSSLYLTHAQSDNAG